MWLGLRFYVWSVLCLVFCLVQSIGDQYSQMQKAGQWPPAILFFVGSFFSLPPSETRRSLRWAMVASNRLVELHVKVEGVECDQNMGQVIGYLTMDG